MISHVLGGFPHALHDAVDRRLEVGDLLGRLANEVVTRDLPVSVDHPLSNVSHLRAFVVKDVDELQTCVRVHVVAVPFGGRSSIVPGIWPAWERHALGAQFRRMGFAQDPNTDAQGRAVASTDRATRDHRHVPAHIDRMIYMDDSGRPQSGLAVYGWIEFHPDHWRSVLRCWLDTRKLLWREYRIAVQEELHTTEYVNGRGRISKHIPDRHLHNGVEFWKDFGREVAVRCLETLRCTEGLVIGSVYRWGSPETIADTKRDLYSDLIARFEDELDTRESLGVVIMDGDGKDSSYRSTHRQLELAKRRIIEDAIHLDSKVSQLVQMADLVAWSASATVDRHEKNSFAWEWYENYLAERDPNREPDELTPRNS